MKSPCRCVVTSSGASYSPASRRRQPGRAPRARRGQESPPVDGRGVFVPQRFDGVKREALTARPSEKDPDRRGEAEAEAKTTTAAKSGARRSGTPPGPGAEHDAERAAQPRSGRRLGKELEENLGAAGAERRCGRRSARRSVTRSTDRHDANPPTMSAIDEMTTSAKNVARLMRSQSCRNASCVTRSKSSG